MSDLPSHTYGLSTLLELVQAVDINLLKVKATFMSTCLCIHADVADEATCNCPYLE